MKLWSIQNEAAYELLLLNKTFQCDVNKSELASEKCFKNAYNWMKNEMMDILDIQTEVYPIWAWYKYENKCKRPNLRKSGYALKGTKCVCLELEIPDSKVVLSDFDLWHYVLNDCYFSQNNNDDIWFENLSSEEQLLAKEKSWKKIFDVIDSSYIQATLFELRIEDIKNIKYFTAR